MLLPCNEVESQLHGALQFVLLSLCPRSLCSSSLALSDSIFTPFTRMPSCIYTEICECIIDALGEEHTYEYRENNTLLTPCSPAVSLPVAGLIGPTCTFTGASAFGRTKSSVSPNSSWCIHASGAWSKRNVHFVRKGSPNTQFLSYRDMFRSPCPTSRVLNSTA